jgi:restriction system protein
VPELFGVHDGHRATHSLPNASRIVRSEVLSTDAKEYVGRIERKIILIDGQQLAGLCIDFGIGVADVASYTVKRIDLDYFEEE